MPGFQRASMLRATLAGRDAPTLMKLLWRAYSSLLTRRSFWILFAFYAVVPPIIGGAVRAVNKNTNDVQDWLPDSYQETTDLRWYVSHFDSGSDRAVVVSWTGCRLDDPRLAMFAAKLRDDSREPPLVDTVLTGPEAIEQLTATPVDLHPGEAIARLEGSLIGTIYLQGLKLKADLQGRPRVHRIAPESFAADSGIPAGAVITHIGDVETPQLVDALRQLITAYRDGPDKIVVRTAAGTDAWSWDAEPKRVAPQTCAMITLSDYGSHDRRMADTLDYLRSVAVDDCAVPAAELRMGGPPVDNVAIDYEGERTLARLAALSYSIGLVMCWFCFRDIRLVTYVFITGMLSQATSLALVHYSGGKVDAIMMSMPTLIYMLTVAASVHIVNYWRDSLHLGDNAAAVAAAVMKGLAPCTMAALTTAVGLASLEISDLVPIRNFGIYSAAAVMASLLWIFLFLPAWLVFWPPKVKGTDPAQAAAPSSLHTRWATIGEFVLKRRLSFFTLGMLLTVVLGYGALYKMRTTVRLMKLFAGDAQIIRDYRWLETNLGSLVPMEVIVHTSDEVVLSFDGQPTAGTFSLTWTTEDEQAMSTGRLSYKADPKKVQAALRAAGLKYAIVTERREEGVRQLRLASDDGRSLPVLSVESQLEGATLAIRHPLTDFDGLHLVDSVRLAIEALDDVDATLSPVTFAPSLRKPRGTPQMVWRASFNTLLERHQAELHDVGFIGADYKTHEKLWRVSLRMSAFDDTDYSEFVNNVRQAVDPVVADLSQHDVRVTYTGLVPLVYKAQNELLRGLFNSYAVAFGLIAMLMMALAWRIVGPLKCIPAGLLLMIPNLFPTAIVFGTISWLGILVDAGTMMAASVGLGVAVDDTVHFITWFRRGMERGLDRRDAVRDAYRHCAVAMTQTTLIAGVGMFVFAASTFTPTQRFGVLMVPLMCGALLGDLVLLPALLVSPLGRVFQSRKHAAKRVELETAVEEATPDEEPSVEVAVPLMRPPLSEPVEGQHGYRVVGLR